MMPWLDACNMSGHFWRSSRSRSTNGQDRVLGAHTNKIKLLIYCWHEQQAATMEQGRAMLRVEWGREGRPEAELSTPMRVSKNKRRVRCCKEWVNGGRGRSAWKVSTLAQTRAKNLLTQTRATQADVENGEWTKQCQLNAATLGKCPRSSQLSKKYFPSRKMRRQTLCGHHRKICVFAWH